MDLIFAEETTLEEATQIQKEIQQYLQEIKLAREQMRVDQLEIERSRARTQTRLMEIQAQMNRLQAS